MSDPIYLDYNATAPIAPEVLEPMMAAYRELWGNASSTHVYGKRAKDALERARAQVASLIGAETDEIIFTGGGTESDNAAILGIAAALPANRRNAVSSNVEHAAVSKALRLLESRGWNTTSVGVDHTGRVSSQEVIDAVTAGTGLVSIMHGQNETGAVQPINDIGAALRQREGVIFHCDAAQSVGKLPIDVNRLGVDALTLAGHKLYGPKGVGALYVRRGTSLDPFLLGAGHEGGRRAGTENVPALVGLGEACALAERELPHRSEKLASLRDRLAAGLRKHVDDMRVHAADGPRLPNTLSVAFPGVSALELAAQVPEVAIGTGAACHSGKAYVSKNLSAMGLSDELALSTLRLCVGRGTSEDEVDRAADAIGRAAARLRREVTS